jgi:hypothetical protein
MRRFAAATLAVLLGCGGGDSNGPSKANVQGTWVLTFTSSGTCQLSQISLVLLADGSSPTEGMFGAYAVTCTGQNPISEPADNIFAYQVSGNNVSVQFSNDAGAQKFLIGTVNGTTITGTFNWNGGYTISGTFTAVKQ